LRVGGGEAWSFDQLARLMTQIGEIVGGEIKDAETRTKILKRFRLLMSTLGDTNQTTEPERPFVSDESEPEA